MAFQSKASSQKGGAATSSAISRNGQLKNWLSSWREGELLLNLVRIIALIMALVLLVYFPQTRRFLVPDVVLIGVVIGYTLIRVAYHDYWRGKRAVIYANIVFDLLICCFLPFVTGALYSPFFIYPLMPILSAALFFPRRASFTVAGIAIVSVIGGEILSRSILHGETYLPVQLDIAMIAIYASTAILIAWLPYVANLNLSTKIKRQAILEERNYLSREIHDGLAQRLSGLLWRLDILQESVSAGKVSESLAQMKVMRRELQDGSTEVRDIMSQLRFAMPEETDFLSNLEQYVQAFTNSSGIKCQLYAGKVRPALPPLVAVELLRITQEALNNVRKHSGADLVEIRFESDAELISLIIKDNGRGFNPQKIEGEHGLAVMKERAQDINGVVEIRSSPGRGTDIEVNILFSNRLSEKEIG